MTTRNCRTEDRAALENDDIERIDRCAEFIAAVLEVRNSLAGDTVTREKSCILGAVTRMSMIYERQETALRNARRHNAAKDEVVAAARKWLACKVGFNEDTLGIVKARQHMREALARLEAVPSKEDEG